MKRFFIIFFCLFTLLLASSNLNNANAETLFTDAFNGSGELSLYNPDYQHLYGFPGGGIVGGIMTVNVDHVIVPGHDPAYIYTAIPGDNICASIDFDWSEGGDWTNIMLRSTTAEWKDAIQVTKQSGTSSWVYYKDAVPFSSGPINFDITQTHTLKACISGSDISGYIDNVLFFTGQDISNTGGYVGFASQIGTNYLDNFKIESYVDLNVPLLKQTSAPWADDEYDFASNWKPTPPIDTSISAWGCALTSAAMVFQYHGYEKLPGNITLDPGTLNDWLKDIPGGYIRNGLVNWLALSRLSKLAKDINGLSFDALEYKRVNGYNPEQLTEDLDNGYPGILGVPGHFVVAKGIEGDTFNINDPYFDRNSLLEEYGNTFNSLGRFIPSSTDLSYIMLIVDENVDILLTDSNNIATGSSSIQEPLDNDTSVGISGKPLNIFYLPQPEDGIYNLNLSSNSDQNYQLDVYFYNIDGNVKLATLSGFILNRNIDEFDIDFNKVDSGTSEINPKNELKFKLGSLFSSGEIKNKGIYNSLISKLNNYEKAENDKTKSNIINALKNELEAQKGKGISGEAYDIIIENINLLT